MTHFHNYCKRAHRAVTKWSANDPADHQSTGSVRKRALAAFQRSAPWPCGPPNVGTLVLSRDHQGAGPACVFQRSGEQLARLANLLKYSRLTAPYSRGSVGASFTLVALEAMRTQGGRSC